MLTDVDVDSGLNMGEYKKVDPASQRWFQFPYTGTAVGVVVWHSFQPCPASLLFETQVTTAPLETA